MDKRLTNERFEISAADEDRLDLSTFLRALARRAWIIWLVAAAIGAAAFAFQVMQPPLYRGEALLMISPPREQLSPSERDDNGQSVDSGFVESQIEILRSRTVLGDVVDRLGLAGQPATSGASAQAKAAHERVRQKAVDILAKQVSARRRGVTYVIEVRAISGQAAQAALLANTWVDAYLESQFNARLQAAQNANAWLGDRLEKLKADVQTKDALVEAYRAKSGLLTTDGVSITEKQVGDLQSSLLKARADLSEKTAQLQQIEIFMATGQSPETVMAVINSPTIRELRTKQTEIQSREAELKSRYSNIHPSVIKAQNERESVERQIREEVARIAASLKNEVDVARTWFATLQASANEGQRRLVGNNQSSVQLRQLERDASASRTIYEMMLARFNEISEAQTYRGGEARLVAEAERPGQAFSPRPRMAALLSLSFGLFAGLVAAALAELLDSSIRNIDTLGERLNRPVLATVPAIRGADMRGLPPVDRTPASYVLARPLSTFAEALRALRMSLVYSVRGAPAKILAVTSALPEEGKTTISICLARTASEAGQHVLLVDCDLRRRSVSALVDGGKDADLINVLTGQIGWRDAVFRESASDCDIVPIAHRAFTPRDLFASDYMIRFIQEAREQYDLVVLDCPPVLSIAETRRLARIADETVLVMRWGRTTLSAAKAAAAKLGNADVDILGVVVNGVVPSRLDYGELAAYSKNYADHYQSVDLVLGERGAEDKLRTKGAAA